VSFGQILAYKETSRPIISIQIDRLMNALQNGHLSFIVKLVVDVLLAVL